MTKLQLRENVFPFKCDNPDCGKEYDLELFTEVILLWGFIYLISEENEVALIGFTCPDCKKTTIRKYRAYIAMQGFQMLRHQCKKRWETGYCIQEPILNRAIYFSPKLLIDHDLISRDSISLTQGSDVPIYSMPEDVDFETDSFSENEQIKIPFEIDEKSIHALVDLENQNKYKAIPRVIPSTSIYMILDKLMTDTDKKSINMALQVHLIRSNSQKDIDHISNFNSDPTKTNDLSSEDFSSFQATHLSWKRESFQKHLPDFINAIPLVRNRIDCELVFRNQLINKYSRRFYYKTKMIEEQRFDDKSMKEYEEMDIWDIVGLEKDELFPPKPIRTISAAQLMNRWDMDTYEIIDLIKHHGLEGFDSINSVSINENLFHPTLIAELTKGDLEEQKRSMDRLRFDPDIISKFENENLQSFAKWDIKIKNSSKGHANKTNILNKEKKLRKNQLHKEAVRKIAEKLWEQDPDKTIADMIFEDEINEVFSERKKAYSEDTLRDWINDLCPDRRPGRRKKK